MTGLQMLLNSLGVKIDPREVEGMFAWVKSEIPKVVKLVVESVKRIESKIDAQNERLKAIESQVFKPDDPNVKSAGVGATELKVNGATYDQAHTARFGAPVDWKDSNG